VLRGIDLEISPGSLVRIKGPNGSGKTTLMRLAAGLTQPSEGRVTVTGRCAHVPDRFAPEIPFDALTYLVHMGKIHGLTAAEATKRAGDVLVALGADAWAKAPLRSLSKGTAQKIAVAQALVADPDVLILDEAWTGLDVMARSTIDEAVDARLAENGAVIFVDHDDRRLPGRAMTVLTLAEGEIVDRTDTSAARYSTDDTVVGIEFEDEDGKVRQMLVRPEFSDGALADILAQPGTHIRLVESGLTVAQAGHVPGPGPGSDAAQEDAR